MAQQISAAQKASLQAIATADTADVQRIAASQIELLADYHLEALNQSKQSFSWALIAAVVGLLFFIVAIVIVITDQQLEAGVISLISGALIEFIAAINLYLYGRTSLQMADFRERLDQTQRFLLANSICESLEGDMKNQARADLIRTIATTVSPPHSLAS